MALNLSIDSTFSCGSSLWLRRYRQGTCLTFRLDRPIRGSWTQVFCFDGFSGCQFDMFNSYECFSSALFFKVSLCTDYLQGKRLGFGKQSKGLHQGTLRSTVFLHAVKHIQNNVKSLELRCPKSGHVGSFLLSTSLHTELGCFIEIKSCIESDEHFSLRHLPRL